MNIKNWINEKYLDEVESLSSKFKSNLPFSHLNLINFLNKSKAEELLKELNSQEYYLEDHDLYQFKRTIDFKNSNSKIIQEFRKFLLSDEFILFLEKITQTKIKKNLLDLHSLKLTNTHYLLCHDDKVQKRNIAFVLNLTKNWTNKDGGELELFESLNNIPTKISKQILPEFNQFTIFKVNEKSFHQISEILSDKERISFSGWYY